MSGADTSSGRHPVAEHPQGEPDDVDKKVHQRRASTVGRLAQAKPAPRRMRSRAPGQPIREDKADEQQSASSSQALQEQAPQDRPTKRLRSKTPSRHILRSSTGLSSTKAVRQHLPLLAAKFVRQSLLPDDEVSACFHHSFRTKFGADESSVDLVRMGRVSLVPGVNRSTHEEVIIKTFHEVEFKHLILQEVWDY